MMARRRPWLGRARPCPCPCPYPIGPARGSTVGGQPRACGWECAPPLMSPSLQVRSDAALLGRGPCGATHVQSAGWGSGACGHCTVRGPLRAAARGLREPGPWCLRRGEHAPAAVPAHTRAQEPGAAQAPLRATVAHVTSALAGAGGPTTCRPGSCPELASAPIPAPYPPGPVGGEQCPAQRGSPRTVLDVKSIWGAPLGALPTGHRGPTVNQ